MASRIPAVPGLVLLSVPSHARDAGDLDSAAARILDARCGACHVPDSENPQARRQLDSVRDLQRFVAETIAPGDPDDSDLWFPHRGRRHAVDDAETLGLLVDGEDYQLVNP